MIRPAERDDVPVLFSLIVELATYERAAERVVGSPELLEQALFGEQPAAEAVVAEVDGQPAGFAIFYTTFSTWLCRAGIWLEDLFVSPAFRRGGIGRALLVHLAALTVARAGDRLEWSALDWNAPALSFYEGVGAEVLRDWLTHRLSGDALQSLAAARPGA